MTLTVRTVLATAACLVVTGCSRGTDVHFVTGSQAAQVSITPSPAAPGTLILSDTDYSYTPLGGSPTGYQNYNDAPIRIGVGTSVAVDLYVDRKRPVSSDSRVLKQVGEHSKDPAGNDVVPFKALHAGTAAITAAGYCPKIRTLACIGPFSVTLSIS
jgi:hypothetical protein